METFDGLHSVALQDQAVCHRLHPKYGDSLLYQLGNNVVGEAAEMGIHRVQGQLARIEVKIVLLRDVEHAFVYKRIFVAGKPDITNFARLPGCHEGL